MPTVPAPMNSHGLRQPGTDGAVTGSCAEASAGTNSHDATPTVIASVSIACMTGESSRIVPSKKNKPNPPMLNINSITRRSAIKMGMALGNDTSVANAMPFPLAAVRMTERLSTPIAVALMTRAGGANWRRWSHGRSKNEIVSSSGGL